jgi:hypothetical protein
MNIYRELYHGWLIVIFQDVHQWLFECHPPEAAPYTTITVYNNQAAALSAARNYISTKNAQSALVRVVA